MPTDLFTSVTWLVCMFLPTSMCLKGEDVLYVCGSDEHGVPITIQARKRGCSPQEVVDEYHKIIAESFKGFGINFDIYGRTTSKIHEKNASDFFKKLYEDGKFITKERAVLRP